MLSKYAILLDGGFVTKKLQAEPGRFPTAVDVEKEGQRIEQHAALANRELLRIYFYDAAPAKSRLSNPINGSSLDLAVTPEYRRHVSLLDTLELTPNFAVRRGEVVVHGWKLGDRAFKRKRRPPKSADTARGAWCWRRGAAWKEGRRERGERERRRPGDTERGYGSLNAPS